MKHLFPASVVLAIVLVAAVVPAVLAAGQDGPGGTVPPEPSPTATPVAADDRIAPDGEISVDPTFITATPSPSPAGDVLGATARPRVTPPPTDAVQAMATPGTTLRVPLLLAVLVSVLALVAVRAPAQRRP